MAKPLVSLPLETAPSPRRSVRISAASSSAVKPQTDDSTRDRSSTSESVALADSVESLAVEESSRKRKNKKEHEPERGGDVGVGADQSEEKGKRGRSKISKGCKATPDKPKPEVPVRKRGPKRKRSENDIEEPEDINEIEGEVDKQPKKKRAKKSKVPELGPYRDRLWNSKKYVGPHVSAAGGSHWAPHNALSLGSMGFALFLKNQRKWAAEPLSEETIRLFKLRVEGKADDPEIPLGDGNGFNPKLHIVPHGNYLVNLGGPELEKREKAYECFVDDIRRANQLGIGLFNFHNHCSPGSSCGGDKSQSIEYIAEYVNRAHKETENVILLLENAAGRGSAIGGAFEELGQIIEKVENKSRVGVCVDTCHAFAAGYDFRTTEKYNETMEELDKHVGLKYLKAIHCNDSKGELDSHKDLHQNIGCGQLGLAAFSNLMCDPRMDNLPIILETPLHEGDLDPSGKEEKVWCKEVRLLYRLEKVGLDRWKEDEEVIGLSKEIEEMVEKGRQRAEAKKQEKAAKKPKRKKPKKGEEEGGDASHDEGDESE